MGYGQGMKPNRESSASPAAGGSLLDSLVQPLRDLQQQYLRALALVEQMERELDGVVTRVAQPSPGPQPRPATASGPARPPLARLQVRFPNQEALLGFEQQLSALEGVSGVTVAGSTPTECTLLVELFGDAPEPGPEPGPTIVCTNCGRVLVEGGPEISHGLCPDCLREFGSTR